MFEFREPLVERWLSWLRATGASTVTVNTYRGELRRLTQWAGGPILYLTHDQLTDWQIHKSREIEATSLRSAMSAHRSFYRWALDENLITVDPTRRLRMPRAPRRLPRPMDERDVQLALESGGLTESAIIALAGFAGLRACEIARLDWSEVRLDGPEPVLRVVKGKGGTERIVDVCDELARYLRALPGARRGPVIRRVDGKAGHVSPARLSQMANRYLHSIGITYTLHTLRHRFGTRVYDESGGDIRATQEALGHASPTSTAIYTRVSRRNIRAAVVAAGRLDTGGNTGMSTITKAAAGGALALVLALAGCGSSSSSSAPAASTVAGQAAATTPPAGKAGPDEQVCHDRSFILMRDALLKDGNFDSLPKEPDRSLGITECKGLTVQQLDALAARLQVELQPFMLGAAASATP